MSEPVLVKTVDNVGWLTLNRPDTRNALSMEMMGRISQALAELGADQSVRVVVIRGEGPVFCAGHNIREMVDAGGDIHQYMEIFETCSRMMTGIHDVPQPVIAQVHGVATAAGCQMVAACDLAIAESGARFATPGVKIGLFCATPMVPLSRVIGRRRAMEMLLTGRFVPADEALRFGLINKVTAPEDLAKETEAWARQIAGASRFTLGFGKRAFYAQIDAAEADAYRYAQNAMSLNAMAEDAQEGMKAFLEKRPPVWKDR